MNIIDIGIIVILLFGAIIGFKRGFTNELVRVVGFILIIIVAYLFKNPLSIFMYEHLPFLSFGFLKGAAILNILLYEVIAFLIVFIILSVILKVLLMVTSVFEKLLTATIILGIPSKLAGAVIGFIHHYIIVFLILYAITLFGINASIINESKFKDQIVNNTPILSKILDDNVTVIEEFKTLKEKYNDNNIATADFNYQSMELFLKYKIISSESAKKLVDSGKIDSKGIENNLLNDLLKKYKEAKND